MVVKEIGTMGRRPTGRGCCMVLGRLRKPGADETRRDAPYIHKAIGLREGRSRESDGA